MVLDLNVIYHDYDVVSTIAKPTGVDINLDGSEKGEGILVVRSDQPVLGVSIGTIVIPNVVNLSLVDPVTAGTTGWVYDPLNKVAIVRFLFSSPVTVSLSTGTVALTINAVAASTPIAVPMTLDSTSITTPVSGMYASGTHTITVPASVVLAGVAYVFSFWDDGTSLLTRSISLTTPLIVTATYVLGRTVGISTTSPLGDLGASIASNIGTPTVVTPANIAVPDGSKLTLTAPLNISKSGTVYSFSKWEDNTTNATRTITVVTNLSLVATYVAALGTHILNVNIQSTPAQIQVPITLDGTTITTPLSVALVQGNHTMSLPGLITAPSGVSYQFVQWNDGFTLPSRTINLIVDLTVTATYNAIGQGQLTIRAFWSGLTSTGHPQTWPVTAQVFIVGVGTSIVTPVVQYPVNPGTYTIQVTFNGLIQSQNLTIQSGIITSVDFIFSSPQPPPAGIPSGLATAGFVGAVVITTVALMSLR